MFWCVVSLYILTRCLYFDSPYGLDNIQHNSIKIYSDATRQIFSLLKLKAVFYADLDGTITKWTGRSGFQFVNIKRATVAYHYICLINARTRWCGRSTETHSPTHSSLFRLRMCAYQPSRVFRVTVVVPSTLAVKVFSICKPVPTLS